MYLYILRHGIAVDSSEWSGDELRPLTPEGKTRTEQIIKELKAKDKLKVTAIWSSPFIRAMQTAQIAGEVLGLPVKTVPEMSCGTTLQLLQDAFKPLKRLPERLMLVGHEPDCGLIIGALIGDQNGDYALKKAGIALLKGDFQSGGMKLVWKLDPKDILK